MNLNKSYFQTHLKSFKPDLSPPKYTLKTKPLIAFSVVATFYIITELTVSSACPETSVDATNYAEALLKSFQQHTFNALSFVIAAVLACKKTNHQNDLSILLNVIAATICLASFPFHLQRALWTEYSTLISLTLTLLSLCIVPKQETNNIPE